MNDTYTRKEFAESYSVRGYGRKKDALKWLDENGIEIAHKDIYKKTLIGIGEMEKLMGKEQFRSILGQYVTKPHGKLTLVPESDRRKAIEREKRTLETDLYIRNRSGRERER